MGGTPMCPLHDRLKVSKSHVLSVLKHLAVTSPIALLSHSVGIYYALDLLESHSSLLHSTPRLATSSPWVPSSISGSSLSFIPSIAITAAVKSVSSLGPGVSRLVDGLGGWSSGISSSIGLSSPVLSSQSQSLKDCKARAKSQKKHPECHFHPPYLVPNKGNEFALDSYKEIAHHPATGKIINHERDGGVKLIQEFMATEGTAGIAQDFLFCLGRAEGADQKLIGLLQDSLREFEENGRKVDITVVWAAEDGLIPIKGRRWLSELLQNSPAVTPTILEMSPPAAHDDPLMSEEVLTSLMRSLKGTTLD